MRSDIMLRLFPILFLFFAVFSSCDEIDPPYTTGVDPIDTSGGTVQRVILLEDFSGARCKACPKATKEMLRLRELYPNRIAPVIIHAGQFAEPRPGFTTDLTTETGDELHNTLVNQIVGYPSGMVNRIEYGGAFNIVPEEWSTNIAALLNSDPSFDITLQTSYNESTRELVVEAEIIALRDFNEQETSTLQFSSLMTESNIIAPQIDDQVRIEDYNHVFILRTHLNGTWGEKILNSIPGTTISKGDTITISNRVTLEDNWKAENCSVVGFVHVLDPTQQVDNNYEVLQAAYDPSIVE
jgi:hypothetical protein